MAPRFATILSCMDGRIQQPILDFLRPRFGVDYLDNITRPGMVKYLIATDNHITSHIIENLEISLTLHDSRQIALVAHTDCLGNPVADDEQLIQLPEAMAIFRRRYQSHEIIGLWLGDNRTVEALD